jgi:hypothetical protein
MEKKAVCARGRNFCFAAKLGGPPLEVAHWCEGHPRSCYPLPAGGGLQSTCQTGTRNACSRHLPPSDMHLAELLNLPIVFPAVLLLAIAVG